MRERRPVLFALLAASAAAGRASAQTTRPAAPPAKPAPASAATPSAGPVEHWVDFRADRVELEPDLGALELKGSVVVTSRRFRLTSQAVTLSRSPRGVHVQGSGNLALCACPHPPVTLGFAAADLAPPTDVLLQHATLRIGPVPVFYSPYLWLRSPDRVGVLPPSIGYRGEEGLWLGSGFHAPLATGENGRRAFELGVAAYLRGGVRSDALLTGLGGRTAVTFDWFRREALDVASAHAATADGRFFAERVDLVRGRRGISATSDLERAVLPSDRVRVAVGSVGRGVFGLALNGDAPRGASLGELGILGPGATLAVGSGIGRYASYDLSSGLASARTNAGDLFAARVALALGSAVSLGVVRGELSARQRAELVHWAGAAAHDVRSELRARAGLPLARRMRSLTHTVEPFVEGALVSGVRATDGAAPALSDLGAAPNAALALLGVQTALGSNTGRGALELDVSGGALAERGAEDGVLGARARMNAGAARLAVDVRSLPARSASELSLRFEARLAQTFGVGLRVDGAKGDARRAQGLWRTDFARPSGAMFDRSGWTARGRVRFPWGPGLFAELGSDVDISEKLWLASSAALGYRHACRCLSLVAVASRRLGRRGFDAGLNVEIVPR